MTSQRRLLLTAVVGVALASCVDAPPASPAGRDAVPVDQRSPADATRLAEIGSHRADGEPVTVAAPTRVVIPEIDVDSELQRLGRDQRGAIEAPGAWDTAGWYADGAKPGQPGPAVILGHVDSRQGPAVFFRLRELDAGDRIVIFRQDGSRVTFVVDRLERHAKTRFPTDDVYLPTLRQTLRLVTCDGMFDRSTGHYRDNLVVFAELATDPAP